MTWKSYAAASGATVLAGWLASAQPVGVPPVGVRPAAPARSPRAASGASSDITEQASRLQARIRRETAFVRPRRNLFQFEAAAAAALAADAVGVPAQRGVPADTPAPVMPSPPVVTLAGVAEDQLQQGVERTAILSSPSGVLLVRVGDDVLGQYRVTVVEAESVELMSLTDGSTLRLSLAATTAR